MSKGKGVRDERGRFVRAAPTTAITSENDPTAALGIARAMAGGRVSIDSQDFYPGMASAWVPPRTPDGSWSQLQLDTRQIGRYPFHKTTELLVDTSPDFSRALSDHLRMVNGEWSLIAYEPDTRKPHARAMKALQALIDRLGAKHGSFDLLLDRLFLNAWMRGAFFAEAVMDAAGRQVVDIALPDPITVRFRRDDENTWTLGQLQRGKYVELTRPTIRYIPIDPLPGSPYGRSPAAPAVFPAMFLLAIMYDIQRVIMQQGYPRIDISIDFDAILAMIPPELSGDPDQLNALTEAITKQVVEKYAALQATDAYVHASTIVVNPGGKAVGAVDASSLAGINGVIAGLERLMVRAAKTQPILMGMMEGASEAASNRQVELQLTNNRPTQHMGETIIEYLFGMALRAEGINAAVEFRFIENRKTEELRDEQVKQLKLANAKMAQDAGYIDRDEAANWAVGHDATGEEKVEPVAPPLNADGSKNKLGNANVKGGQSESTPPKGEAGKAADKPKPQKEAA